MHPGAIQLRHLRAFTEIARRRSFRRAAEALALTQPAISKTMRELETALRAPLFLRSRAGVVLTPAGEGFLPFAELSLSALTQGLDGLGAAGQGARLTVGALPSVAARLMPTAVEILGGMAPDLRLTVVDGAHRHLLDRLRGGGLDAMVGRLGSEELMQGLSFAQLYQEQVAFVVRPGHPLCGSGALAEVARWPVIYPSEGAAIRPLVDRMLIAAGIPALPRRLETVSQAFGAVFTRRSDAVWIISEGVVAAEIEEGRLVRLPIDTTLTRGPVGLLVRADQDPTHAHRIFVRAVRLAVDRLALA